MLSYQILIVQDSISDWSPDGIIGMMGLGLFDAGWAALMVSGFLGEESIRLDPDGLNYERRALIRYRRRFVPLVEIRSVRAATEKIMHDGDVKEHRVVQFETSGEPLNFALGLEEREQKWLVALVCNQLERLVEPAQFEEQDDESEGIQSNSRADR